MESNDANRKDVRLRSILDLVDALIIRAFQVRSSTAEPNEKAAKYALNLLLEQTQIAQAAFANVKSESLYLRYFAF